MKKLFTSLAISAIGVVSAQIPNPSFETWTGYLPDGWYVTFSGSSQVTQAHSGNYALKMNVWSGPHYGSITKCPQSGNRFPLGNISPTALTGWYISNFVNGDQLQMTVTIYGGGTTTGGGSQYLNTNSSSYTQFNIPIYMFGSIADSAYIQFNQISASYSPMGLDPATYVILDDINFDGIVGIPSSDKKDFRVSFYPNPGNGSYTLQVSDHKDASVSIYNSLGQKVLDKSLDGPSTALNLSALMSGIYYVRVNGKDGVAYTEKFIQQ